MAQAVYRALSSPRPVYHYPVGPRSRLLPLLGMLLPTGVLDVVRTRMLGVYQPFDSAKGAAETSASVTSVS